MVILIDVKEAAVLTGYHRIHLFNLMKKGDFPPAIHVPAFGQGRPPLHFRREQVEAWLADRLAKKTAKRKAQFMSAADAREAGNADFADAEARNAAAVEVSEGKAEDKIRKGLEVAKREARL